MSTHPSPTPPGRRSRPARRTGSERCFTEPVLVVHQRDKIVEVTNEYDVYARNGCRLGTVVQVGQSRLAKMIRFVGKSDHFKTVHLEVRDPHGAPVLRIIRPARIVRSRAVVQRPDGADIGEIRQDNALGRIRFSLLVDGRRIGRIVATTWWARELTITDHDGVEVARIISHCWSPSVSRSVGAHRHPIRLIDAGVGRDRHTVACRPRPWWRGAFPRPRGAPVMAVEASVSRAAGGGRRQPIRSTLDAEGGHVTLRGPSGHHRRRSARPLGPCGLEHEANTQLFPRPVSRTTPPPHTRRTSWACSTSWRRSPIRTASCEICSGTSA